MQCNKCGFIMSSFDADCPRCVNLAQQAQNQPAAPAQQPIQQSMPPQMPYPQQQMQAPPVANPFGQYPGQPYLIGQPLPEGIRGFNCGAFFFTWIWGLAHGVYWPLVILVVGLIPGVGAIVSIVIAIVLGCQGNELAWKNRRWRDVEEFKTVQKIWNNWGFGLLAVVAGMLLLLLLGLSVSHG